MTHSILTCHSQCIHHGNCWYILPVCFLHCEYIVFFIGPLFHQISLFFSDAYAVCSRIHAEVVTACGSDGMELRARQRRRTRVELLRSSGSQHVVVHAHVSTCTLHPACHAMPIVYFLLCFGFRLQYKYLISRTNQLHHRIPKFDLPIFDRTLNLCVLLPTGSCICRWELRVLQVELAGFCRFSNWT